MSSEPFGTQNRPCEPSFSLVAGDPLDHTSSWYQSCCRRPCWGTRSLPHYQTDGPTNRHYCPPPRWASRQGLYRPRAYGSVNAVKLLELKFKPL